MSLEQIPHGHAKKLTGPELVRKFGNLEHEETDHDQTFHDLEQALSVSGFSLGLQNEVRQIMENSNLFCRNESFTRVIDLLLDHTPITIKSEHPNMTAMSTGEGFRVAMLEGFAGKDVRNVLKVVVTFKGDHLSSHDKVAKDSEMWNTKPKNAALSIIGNGSIEHDDIAMVSFKFPVRPFPESFLSQEERERIEEQGISFVVRHFIPKEMGVVH